MPQIVTIPLNASNPIATVARVASDAVCLLMSQLVKGVLGAGQKDQHALACVVSGGTIGTLQFMASVIGKAKDNDEISAEAITDDTVLLAALVSACAFTVKPTGNPNAVSVDFKHEPQTYRRAMAMFQKLTGREADGLLHTDMLAYARMSDSDILLAEAKQVGVPN
jgi:hypothetical protein